LVEAVEAVQVIRPSLMVAPAGQEAVLRSLPHPQQILVDRPLKLPILAELVMAILVEGVEAKLVAQLFILVEAAVPEGPEYRVEVELEVPDMRFQRAGPV
jgi:hypothetical protein